MNDRYLFTIRVDIAPEHEQAFNEWYSGIHVPELLALPGFISARRYRAIEGAPRFFTLYEIAEPGVLHSEGFQKVRGFYQFTPHISNFARNVYERIYPPVTE
ncbi:MAG: hypothetical protein A3G80_15320 [Betaproteobacteria bacterium RIFCSPLOWO2_12_FULL_62_13b]|nr:MAG: hypothetical protein A3G80_15320 [Betaproteobacteria bacterium RIFCSPLOWO2_12_FULL_62_13b]